MTDASPVSEARPRGGGSGLWVAVLLLAAATLPAEAGDPRISSKVQAQSLPSVSRVPNGQYVTAEEAYAIVSRHADVVLIDVRTYGETIFNGIAPQVHRHIPYVQRDDDHSFDEKSKRYRLVPNPDFIKAVDNLLTELKLDRSATLIVGCSVGERSAKAVNLLAQSGFPNAYTMVDGFEGNAGAEHGRGWQASRLPWSFEMTRMQAYKSPSF